MQLSIPIEKQIQMIKQFAPRYVPQHMNSLPIPMERPMNQQVRQDLKIINRIHVPQQRECSPNSDGETNPNSDRKVEKIL